MGITSNRIDLVNFLFPLVDEYGAIFIPSGEAAIEAINYTMYLKLFSTELWYMICFKCLIFASLIFIIQKFHHIRNLVIDNIFYLVLGRTWFGGSFGLLRFGRFEVRFLGPN